MAAFETNLVAINWHEGAYSVVSQIIAHVDSRALECDGLLHDASSDVGYIDKAAVVQRLQFEKYLLSEANPWHKAAREWYDALPGWVMFILVHQAEWESGLGD